MFDDIIAFNAIEVGSLAINSKSKCIEINAYDMRGIARLAVKRVAVFPGRAGSFGKKARCRRRFRRLVRVFLASCNANRRKGKKNEQNPVQ